MSSLTFPHGMSCWYCSSTMNSGYTGLSNIVQVILRCPSCNASADVVMLRHHGVVAFSKGTLHKEALYNWINYVALPAWQKQTTGVAVLATSPPKGGVYLTPGEDGEWRQVVEWGT